MSGLGLKGEWADRIGRFQRQLRAQGVDGALIIQKMDLYYLSGTDQNAVLWVPTSGEPLLFVRKSLERAKQDAAMDQVIPLSNSCQMAEVVRGQSAGRAAHDVHDLSRNSQCRRSR